MIEKYSIDQFVDYELISLKDDQFLDEEFPPNITSLMEFDDKKSIEIEEKWSNYDWISLNKTYKEISLLKDVSCKDVIQGSLGNCYFLSVCAVMAEFPHRLKKIFLITQINQAGIYAVKFFIDGEVKKIIIDDMIPYDSTTKKLAFSKLPRSSEIWTILMEKAWAKFLGNYQRTISGVPNDVFNILTGAPSHHYSTRKLKNNDGIKNKKWKELCDFYLKNYLICCSTHSEYFYEKYNDNHDVDFQLQEHIKRIDKIRELGLVTNHAYSVMLCHEELIDNNETVQLIKLRNPWGVLNHNKLSFESSLMKDPKYDGILVELGKLDEGVFILTYDEFLMYFSDIYVCKYMDNYNVKSRILFNDENNYNHFFAFKITLTESTDKIFFTAAKPTRLLFCNKEEGRLINQVYSSIWLGSFNSKNRLNYISHSEGFDSYLTIEMENLDKGEYYVLIHIDEHQTKIIDKNLVGSFQIYTNSNNIAIETYYNFDDIILFTDLCHSFYINYNKNFSHKKYLTEDKLIYSDSLAYDHSSYSFIIFENLKKNEKIVMDVLIEISSTLGVESIMLKEKSLMYRDLTLNYGENLIIPFYKAGFTYKYSYRTYTFLNKDELMEETRKSGQIYIINIDDREVYYYFYKHKTGMVFRFTNFSEVFLIIRLQITEIYNLCCSEENTLDYELFLEPETEMFKFYELIDINEGFQLKWKITADVQY